jgi:hypothetical protein
MVSQGITGRDASPKLIRLEMICILKNGVPYELNACLLIIPRVSI